MKILFVVQDIDWIEPVGLMTISSLAKARGHETSLGILSREDVLRKIERFKPDVIGYSATTGEHKYYLDFNKEVKSRFKNIFTIMGGAHTTFYPECITNSTFDAICVGEGDEAFPEILTALEKGGNIHEIKNIVTRNGSPNGVRNLYENLDSLPFPDRDLFYKNTEMGIFPLKSFITSRGCPYPCTYCFNHAFAKMYSGKGRLLRRHSVDYVIREIRDIKNRYRLGFIKFYDDIFVDSVNEWFEEFVKQYKKEINLPFNCQTRANLLTEDIVKLLKEAGCYSMCMSIEAGNPEFRNRTLKRNMSNEEIMKAFDLCYKYGISTFTNAILGLPYSTINNEIETVDLILKCRATFGELPIFHPYPRTELGNFCIEKGLFKGSFEDLHMSYQNKSPLTCFTEREKEIQKNISELAVFVFWMPFLRNIVMKYLIYLPHNRLFFWIYYISKVYLVNIKIYPFKLRLRDMWKFFTKSLNLERFKHTDERFERDASIKQLDTNVSTGS